VKPSWWHIIVVLLIGIGLDYFFPGFANATLGKLGVVRKS
jgi:hypothetical protein